MANTTDSFLIVGAGVFGASTALHLSRHKPEASITLMDRAPFPDPIAASYDINKVVRADYEDLFYCKLGLRALEYWRNDPLWKPFYHQAGMVTIVDEPGVAGQIKENFEKLGVKNHAELLSPDEIRGRFEGMYADSDYTDIEEIFWNPESGWAEAANALEATIKAAIENGVKYIVESVTSIVRDGSTCRGVKTDSGKEYNADSVILSTGAYTAQLLADSFPDEPHLQAQNRISAAGVCEAAIHLTEEQQERFKKTPVFVLDANATKGETMPPTLDGELKFIRDINFANTITHPKTGEQMMVPMTGKKTSQWTQPEAIPSGLREEIATVIKGIYGKHADGLAPATYRFCWDASTPDNNFFITPHPRVPHLFVSTMGTWHGWKFLPILGEYTVSMLEGKLSEEEIERWSWDRQMGKAKRQIPRELKDIKGYHNDDAVPNGIFSQVNKMFKMMTPSW